MNIKLFFSVIIVIVKNILNDIWIKVHLILFIYHLISDPFLFSSLSRLQQLFLI